MLLNAPKTLALDFDGVLCNGLKEYFQTTWRAYRQIWPTSHSTPSDQLAEVFYRLRPVVETGWEMPILLRAILKGFPEAGILEGWAEIRTQVVAQEDLNAKDLAARVDAVRDQWIAEDLTGWLELHHFYPGVSQRLAEWQQQQINLLIITTKESRFVQALLQQQGLHLASDRIFGKDRNRPKFETLRRLQAEVPTPIWFLEDRLLTLEKIKEFPDLEEIGLFLADWGYNTAKERRHALQDHRIQLLTGQQFAQDFATWV